MRNGGPLLAAYDDTETIQRENVMKKMQRYHSICGTQRGYYAARRRHTCWDEYANRTQR